MLQLRPYQHAAVDAVYQHLREYDDNPVVVMPVGSGKTAVLATICRDAVAQWNGRVLVVSHVKELIQQAADKLQHACSDLEIGLYSAGLHRRDTRQSVIVAGIQSVFRHAGDFKPFDLVIVDECHTIPADGDGMYRTFLTDATVINPQLRVIGLTATPFRMSSGSICAEDHFLNRVCYEIGIKELIRDGYLSPLISRGGSRKADTTQLHVRGGEFVATEAEELMDEEALVQAACREIVEATEDRQACLIFAAGVRHGRHVCDVMRTMFGVECGFVCGDTPTTERDELLVRFRGEPLGDLFPRPPLKYLCNVNVLTTGFDAPHIDCIAILRPTMSPGLLVQMVGRGCRRHPGKQDCLVLDYGQNIVRHGPIDQIAATQLPNHGGGGEAPAKECPQCRALIATAYVVCPDCGYQFPPTESSAHESQASTAHILSGQVTDTDFEVRDIAYSVHTKRGADEDAPKTMRVEYMLGLDYWVSEWVCFEHTGFARHKAELWWRPRSPDPVPDTAQQAVDIALAGGVATTDEVTVRSIAGEKFDRIIGYQLGPMPEGVESASDPSSWDDIPF